MVRVLSSFSFSLFVFVDVFLFVFPTVAMPRGILNFMNSPSVIPGLTRANISSHLQKYRKKVAAKKNRKVEDDDEEFDFGYESLTLEGDQLVC